MWLAYWLGWCRSTLLIVSHHPFFRGTPDAGQNRQSAALTSSHDCRALLSSADRLQGLQQHMLIFGFRDHSVIAATTVAAAADMQTVQAQPGCNLRPFNISFHSNSDHSLCLQSMCLQALLLQGWVKRRQCNKTRA